MIQSLRLSFWTYFERDPELGGAWVAHVLDLDLIAQGETLTDAIEAARDAATTIVIDDLSNGRSFADRRAPAEYYQKLKDLLESRTGQQLTSVVKAEKDFTKVGTQIVVGLHVDDGQHAESPVSPELPVAWPECA